MSDPATEPIDALATVDDFMLRMPQAAKTFGDPPVIAQALIDATDHLETLVDRRLYPFSGYVYEDRLFGIDPNEYGGTSIGIPLPWAGSLGVSYADALGDNNLVRHFWLDQFAPVHPELWTYSIESIVLDLTYGNSMTVDFANGGITGPAKTDGHAWLRLGTFAPEGTRITVTYGGGYTVGIPQGLKRACCYQAAKFMILDAEPQMRSGVDVDELDAQITSIMAAWARG